MAITFLISFRYLGFYIQEFSVFLIGEDKMEKHKIHSIISTINTLSILTGPVIAIIRLSEPYTWKKFSYSCKKMWAALRGKNTVIKESNKQGSEYSLVAFLSKQMNIEVVYQILYGLGKFNEAYIKHQNPLNHLVSSGIDDNANLNVLKIQEVHPSCFRRAFNFVCCKKVKDVEIKRVKIERLVYDDIKCWDIYKVKSCGRAEDAGIDYGYMDTR